MSSDEGGPSSPVLPDDSDRGSSVSSELQDEYEELLRHAVVTPKFEPISPSQFLQMSQLATSRPGSHLSDGHRSQPAEDDSGRHSDRVVAFATASPLHPASPCDQLPEEVETLGPSPESNRSEMGSEESRRSSPDAIITVETEVSVSEENMSKMENLLDTWGNNLKSNVLMELRKWKLAFAEQHKLALRKEREKHEAEVATITTEMDGLKDLLHTFETSSQRKDEVIKSLSAALDRQRERLEMMRSLTKWKLRHGAMREEAQGLRVADQHYQQTLKRKVWLAWHSLISGRWKERMERACRNRAEEVCLQLSNDYESKMAEHVEALQRAQAEIQKLRVQRERYEDSMKKAFMRGVCALNMEALSMFHGGDARPQETENLPPPDDQGLASLASVMGLQPRAMSSSAFSDVAFGPEMHSSSSGLVPGPSRTDADRMSPGPFLSHVGPGSSMSLQPKISDPLPHSSTSAPASTTAPPGGTVISHRQASSRVASAGSQRPNRTVTARVTGRAEPGRSNAPNSIRVTSTGQVASSVVVERHHPVSQFSVGQTAARYPRSIHQTQALAGSRSATREHRANSSSHIHTVKVVE